MQASLDFTKKSSDEFIEKKQEEDGWEYYYDECYYDEEDEHQLSLDRQGSKVIHPSGDYYSEY